MPDNSSRGHLRGLGAADVAKAALLAVLLLTPVLVGVSMLGVSVAQPKYSAWLKLVTDSWDGVAVTDPDSVDPPVLPNGPGFADRYNVTNACVEVYRLKSFGGYDFAGTFYPNGTGFVRIEWPSEWQNVTVIVKAKSYQGQCIGTGGNPYSGIIIYWLTVNPTDSFRTQFGVGAGNVTVGDDGIEVNHAGDFDWDEDAPFGSGPVDIVQYDSGPVTFKINHEDARNAWVARAAYIFKLFHEHTWYSVDDVLTYAIITIYDVDHTAASSPHSLLQAAITGSDGQSRYTREIYPASQGVGSGRFANNKLVPIPLQVINLGAKKPFIGGIGAPESDDPVDAPHLNVTKRVWWETVLTNQTFYVGNEYNGTGGYDDNVVAGKYVPLFGAFAADPTLSPTITQGGITGVPAGPMSLVLNHTVPGFAEGLEDWGLEEGIIGVANLDNNTVFYARFCVQDADLSIQHPEVGDKMVGAEVTINFKTATDRPYYLSHNILTTDGSGCTATPHKWPGYLDEFSKFARFPNGTNWGLRGSLNVSKHFNPADDASPAWRPGGYFERAWGGDWRGPYNNAGKNWSALIPDITYMKTRQLSDDKNWDGFDVQVKWKGGSRNSYGGESVLVDSVRVKNPYAIALLYSYTAEDIFGGWVFPYTELANNKFWLKIHKAAEIDFPDPYDDVPDPNPTWLEIMGPFRLTLTGFDSTTGTFDVTITANGPLVVNNATDPESVVDWSLEEDDTITIEGALVSFKKHDITEFFIAFEAGQGQADRGADGSDDYTSVDEVFVSGGPFEVEFWPGEPGSGTVRALISGHDVDVCIWPNNLNTCPNIWDFTGALLVKGPPRIVEFLVYEAGGGSVSGNYETRAGPISYTYTTAPPIELTSISTFDVFEVPNDLGQGGDIEVPVSGTALIDIDDDDSTDDLVEIDGTVTVSVEPLPLHYAWLWTETGAFSVTGASTTLNIDWGNDNDIDVTTTCDDFTIDSPVDVTTYHDPDTGAVTITAVAPVTVQCIAENIDLDEDTNYDDSYTVTLSATMTIVGQQQIFPAWNNLWLPIDWTGGSISVSGPLEIDIDSDGVDFTIPVSGNRPGSTLTDLLGDEVLPIDLDSYTNTGTLTCTISGTVPATGSSPADITCTGTLDFTIDIDDDGTSEVQFTGLPLSGSGTITTSHDGLGNVLIWGSISVAAPPVIGDLDNDGSSDDTLQITKTVDVNIAGTIDFPNNVIDVDSGAFDVTGEDWIDIGTNDGVAPPEDIVAEEVGTFNLAGVTITLSVPSVVSGIFQSGQILFGGLFFADTASEQVFVYGEFLIGSVTQTGDLPPQETEIYLELYGVGSIDNANGLEASGAAFMQAAPIALYETGVDSVTVEGVFTLVCEPVGEFFAGCSLTVDFDGQTDELGAPFSGTLVINDFTIFGVFGGSMFASLEEEEELEISGDTPEDYNLAIGETEYTSDSLTLNGGILSVGPIVKAKLDAAYFAFGHELALSSLFEDMTLGGTAIDTTIFGDDDTIPVGGEQSFSISLTDYPRIDITSFVVPLPDLSADNEDLDNRLFGRYDDFALTGTGIVYITAWVHDIAYKIVDNMGNTLPSSNIAVTLIRPNGNPVTRSDQINWDQFQGNLAWSYSQWAGADTGYAIFYQLPGDQAYGLTVSFDGQVVHEEQFQIEKLTETVIDTIVVNVVKLKIVIVDCNGETLDSPYFRYINVRGVLRTDRADQHGARDFGMIAGGGEIKILGVWWKGVWVPFVKATLGAEELTLNPDGSLTITLDRNYDVPVKLYANILDITFTTWDLNKDNKIPRLNVTLTWVGEHPLTGRKLWFLETLDPTGDTNTDPFNTTKRVDQFLQYTVEYKQSEPDISGQLKTYGTVEYTFYQMPPTYYNITVTTVTDPDYDPETEQTPGNSKWPGRNVPVPYEIKIKYTSTSSPPVELTEPADYVNDRVVLRIISTLNPDSAKYGTPVTDTWPFSGAKALLNPEGVGDFTAVKECAVSRDLLTWAQTFYKRIVDGDGQRRIGDATYDIINDNNVRMEFYNPVTGLFEPSHESFWTEDTVDTTWLKAHSQFSSVIWWNGSYRAENLNLPTNMSLTVNKFWNNSVEVTKVYAKHNFTVQPSLAHFRAMHPWYVANWTDINATVSPYGTAIVFEKGTLLLPAPVTFVKPQAIDKGGSPLEGALVESWILDLDKSKSVRIDTADSGSEWLTDDVELYWNWVLKQVADPDQPQRFKTVRWDRVYLTITTTEALPSRGVSIGAEDVILNFTAPRETRISLTEEMEIIIHLVGATAPDSATFTVELRRNGDLLASETSTLEGEGDFGISTPFGTFVLTISDILAQPPQGVQFDLSISGTIYVPGAEVISQTILVQVPPYPAKLYLRDILGWLDLAVTARDVTVLVDDLDTPDGQLRYGQWKTQANGLIKSFTIPGYEGLLMLPTSGWLADAYADVPEVEEFHYQFNVVWKSAVVYSDNYVLDKRERVFGASEVYDVTFMFTLSNSTATADAVRNLNLWIYYPNVTTWWDEDLWNTIPDKPQDYEACEDSAFPCKLRVTLISSADPDGVVQFSKIPGPRFMNTTWKYVFSANHSAITWLDDLVATQFVLNNETFGDGPLKVVTTRTITVPIMLNAAHQLYFLVLGWRDEQGIATAYPLEGFNVRYEIRRRDAGLTVASGTAVSGANGVGEVRSDPTDPRKVLWAGLTVRYRVEPPSWLINVNDAKWKDLLGARNVQVVEYGGYAPDPRPSIGAYYPDEVPSHWAIREIDTKFIGGWCFGLCTAFIDGRQQSKPFVINVDYTIVTVRALDFNGRPLRGAFVEIVERASGRIAGWSYTFGSTWTRQPIDLQTLYSFHRVALLPARTVGGDGYTEFMPVAVGPWNYDANNDDRVDASGYRGDDPRTPSAEGTALQYIVRVYWAATDANPDNANGDLRAIWPFIDPQKPFTTTEAGQSVRKYHVKVYDSDFDETDERAKTLVVPIDAMIEIRKPSELISKYDGKHRDVTTAVFDLKLLLNYEGKTLPEDLKTKIEVWVFKKTGAVSELALRFRGGPTIDTVTVNKLPRGVYEVRVVLVPTGDVIFTRTFDISTVNVGTVQAEASLPFTDLSFEVTDLRGRPLPISEAQVTVEPRELFSRVSVAGNVVTIVALREGAPVTVTVRYSSPVYGTSADASITDSAAGFKTRLLGGRTLQLPVDDVTVTVVDRQGRPIGGAVVKLGQAPAKSTGGDGRAVFERVPLESAGRGITYPLSVTISGVEVTPADARSVELSTARTSITVLGELFSLPVRVIGQLGQGLEGANVRVVKGAVTVASSSTDSGGFAQFDRLVLDTYTVVANYKGYSQEVSVSSADLQAGRVVEITLPVYTELLGIPMPLSTLLALIIGLILLVVVLAIIVSEYRWWRGRRLGVYPPAPPKAPK